MIIIENNKYYVYEWIRLDSNEPFYIGKGSGDRWRILTRENNHHFNNIVKTIPVAVNILLDNLTESEAYQYECWFINEYLKMGFNLVNLTDGGENPPILKGELNGNYMNYWTDEQKEISRLKMLGRYDGKDNPNSKRIMCIETGEIFDCILDAQLKYNIKTYSSLTIALHGDISRVAGGYHWTFLTKDNEEYFKDTQNRFTYLLKCLSLSKSTKYYINTNTQEIFNKNELTIKEKISNRKFNNFIKNNLNYMLVSEYYSRIA